MRIDKVLTLAPTKPVAAVSSLPPTTASTSVTAPTPTTIIAAAPPLPLDTIATYIPYPSATTLLVLVHMILGAMTGLMSLLNMTLTRITLSSSHRWR